MTEHETEISGALTVSAFCQQYSLGRTKFYAELNSGRLTALKLGAKTLVSRAEAERWLKSLPQVAA
jgi:excisionase family DNA binding protein